MLQNKALSRLGPSKNVIPTFCYFGTYFLDISAKCKLVKANKWNSYVPFHNTMEKIQEDAIIITSWAQVLNIK